MFTIFLRIGKTTEVFFQDTLLQALEMTHTRVKNVRGGSKITHARVKNVKGGHKMSHTRVKNVGNAAASSCCETTIIGLLTAPPPLHIQTKFIISEYIKRLLQHTQCVPWEKNLNILEGLEG